MDAVGMSLVRHWSVLSWKSDRKDLFSVKLDSAQLSVWAQLRFCVGDLLHSVVERC